MTHGRAGGADGRADRVAHVRPPRQLVPEPGEDEQRVVDADGQAEHQRQDRRGRLQVDEPGQRGDAERADGDADERGQQVHPGGDQRAVGERQHDQRGDARRCTSAGPPTLGRRLAMPARSTSAVRPGVAGRPARSRSAPPAAGGDLRRLHPVRDRAVGGPLVRRDRGRLRVRAGRSRSPRRAACSRRATVSATCAAAVPVGDRAARPAPPARPARWRRSRRCRSARSGSSSAVVDSWPGDLERVHRSCRTASPRRSRPRRGAAARRRRRRPGAGTDAEPEAVQERGHQGSFPASAAVAEGVVAGGDEVLARRHRCRGVPGGERVTARAPGRGADPDRSGRVLGVAGEGREKASVTVFSRTGTSPVPASERREHQRDETRAAERRGRPAR